MDDNRRCGQCVDDVYKVDMAIYGRHLDDIWTILGAIWTIHTICGELIGEVWTISGRHVIYSRCISEMDDMWTMNGRCMVDIWTIYGRHMFNTWAIHGRHHPHPHIVWRVRGFAAAPSSPPTHRPDRHVSAFPIDAWTIYDDG